MKRSASIAPWFLLTAIVLWVPCAYADTRVQAGFAAAQQCEGEIDDDLGSYEECINHAANTLRRQPHALAGLHFQAWLVADLAARQHGPRAAAMRRAQQRGIQIQSRAAGVTLHALCTLKNLHCADVKARMMHKLD